MKTPEFRDMSDKERRKIQQNTEKALSRQSDKVLARPGTYEIAAEAMLGDAQKSLANYLTKRIKQLEKERGTKELITLLKNIRVLTRDNVRILKILRPKEKYVELPNELSEEEGESWRRGIPEHEQQGVGSGEVIVDSLSKKYEAKFNMLQASLASNEYRINKFKRELREQFPGEYLVLLDFEKNLTENRTN